MVSSSSQRSRWAFSAAAILIAAVAPAQVPSGSEPGAAPSGGSADPANGQRIFTDTCVICHGEDGLGGHGGGAPLDKLADAAAVMQTVEAGRNSMPAFREILTPEEIRDVAAYVVEGLPAVRAR